MNVTKGRDMPFYIATVLVLGGSASHQLVLADSEHYLNLYDFDDMAAQSLCNWLNKIWNDTLVPEKPNKEPFFVIQDEYSDPMAIACRGVYVGLNYLAAHPQEFVDMLNAMWERDRERESGGMKTLRDCQVILSSGHSFVVKGVCAIRQDGYGNIVLVDDSDRILAIVPGGTSIVMGDE